VLIEKGPAQYLGGAFVFGFYEQVLPWARATTQMDSKYPIATAATAATTNPMAGAAKRMLSTIIIFSSWSRNTKYETMLFGLRI